jgi:hypothetical protein
MKEGYPINIRSRKALASFVASISLFGCTVTQEDNDIVACKDASSSRSPVEATYPGEEDYSRETDPHVLQKRLKARTSQEQDNDGAGAMRVDQVGLDRLVCDENGTHFLTVEATSLIKEED